METKSLMQKNENFQYRARRNNQIRAAQVRLIDSDGTNVGIVSLQDALRQARERELDLIEINPKAYPVIVKIMDYGKMLYEEKKKLAAAKKNQKTNDFKELTFRPNTDDNDLLHKLQQTREFLSDGAKVKLSVKFRGREITHPELGRQKLEWFIQQLTSIIAPNSQISSEGKIMSVIVAPK